MKAKKIFMYKLNDSFSSETLMDALDSNKTITTNWNKSVKRKTNQNEKKENEIFSELKSMEKNRWQFVKWMLSRKAAGGFVKLATTKVFCKLQLTVDKKMSKKFYKVQQSVEASLKGNGINLRNLIGIRYNSLHCKCQ